MKTGSMVIVPFKPEHLDTFKPGDREKLLWPLPNPSALVGKAYSAMEKGTCFGIGGVFNGTASLMLSDDFRKRPITLSKVLRKCMRHFRRLGATSTDLNSARWLRHLGFHYEKDFGWVWDNERH